MAGEWRTSTWGEEISLEYGKALRDYDKDRGKFRVFGSNGPIGWTSQPLAAGPGVILGRKGAYRGIEFSREPFFVIDTAYYVVPKTEFDMRWLYYAMKFHKLGEIDDGSPIPSTTRSAVYVRDFDIPPLAEQRAIAGVLGALDDKIELNRRMNATLEGIARALFQSWFIDFDPVRRNMDRNQPSTRPSGHPSPSGRRDGDEGASGLLNSPATDALFPDSFQDSPLGPIPNGWTVGTVGDLATFSRGVVNPSDFPYETFDHFSLPAFDNGRTPKVELGSAIMSNKLIVRPNSVLLSKLNPHIPRIWLPDLHSTRRSVCSTEFIVACSKPDVSREYLFSLFTTSSFANVYCTLVTGTSGSHQRIRPESVLEMKVVIPPPQLIQAFTAVAKPMFDCINRNLHQSRTLATLRDTLLPKLLSGELSVAAIAARMEALK